MASPDLQEDPGLGIATSLAPALPPLPLVVLPSSRLALSSQHLQGMSGALAQCWFAALHGLGLLPSPAPSLLSAAHGHASSRPGQNRLPSVCAPGAPLSSRDCRVLPGAYHVLTHHLLSGRSSHS